MSASLGLVVGGIAAMWGVVVAVLEQPTTPDKRLTDRLCAGLLCACVAVTAAGTVTKLTGLW